jgi:osmotically-inducible protein OsmY
MSLSKPRCWRRCARIRACRHPEEVAVAVDEDAVTLRGTAGSFGQRRAAVKDARSAEGVHYVYDDLSVRLLDAVQRSDAVLRGMALQSIAWDAEAPAELIDVKVEDHWVTLRGTVSWQFQRANQL